LSIKQILRQELRTYVLEQQKSLVGEAVLLVLVDAAADGDGNAEGGEAEDNAANEELVEGRVEHTVLLVAAEDGLGGGHKGAGLVGAEHSPVHHQNLQCIKNTTLVAHIHTKY